MLGRGKKKSSSSETPAYGVFYLPRFSDKRGIFADGRSDYIFVDFLKEVQKRTGKPFSPKAMSAPDSVVNEYIKNYGLVAIVIDGAEKMCFSFDYRNKLSPGFIDRVQSLGILPDDTVLWSDDVFKTPRPMPAREVIYGQKPEKPPQRRTRAQVRASWAHPQELSDEELRFLMGQGDDPEG